MPLRRSLVALSISLSAGLALSCSGDGSDLGPGRVYTVAVTPGNARLEPGQTVQLSVSVYDLEGTLLTGESPTWRTSDDAVATVSSTGLVTAVDVGTAGVTAVVEGRSVTARITVGQLITTIEITPEAPEITVGRSVQLKATAYGPGGKALASQIFEWSSSDLRVAPVNVGKVRGIRPGVALIEATTDGKSDTTTVTVVIAGEPLPDPRVVGR